jgi:hypothetical protein
MEFTTVNILVIVLIIVVVMFLVNTVQSNLGGKKRMRSRACPHCHRCPCAQNCPFRRERENFDVGRYSVNTNCAVQKQLESNYEMVQGGENMEREGHESPLEKQLINELWTENQLQMQLGDVPAEDKLPLRAPRDAEPPQEAELPQINKHKVEVDCGCGPFGKRVDGEVMYRKKKNEYERELCGANAYRKLAGDTFDFATMEHCDCHKGNGCSVCELKHNNDHVISDLLCTKETPLTNCYIDNVESDNISYVKGLQTGGNVL